jgi:hypothetical protein
MSAVDKRNDCMATLYKPAAKFAADQPGGTGYENAATGSWARRIPAAEPELSATLA